MAELQKDKISTLREKMERQRNTVASLKRDGHDCPDAERQLRELETQFHADEDGKSRRDNSAANVTPPDKRRPVI